MGAMVSRASFVLGVALATSATACGAAREVPPLAPVAPAEPPAATSMQPATGFDLGGGCTMDVPNAMNRRDWATDQRARAATESATLNDGRRVVVWRDGSPERGFSLRAVALDGEGVALGPPVTVSERVIGKPLAAAGPERRVRIWFLEDAEDDGTRQLATTVHCP